MADREWSDEELAAAVKALTRLLRLRGWSDDVWKTAREVVEAMSRIDVPEESRAALAAAMSNAFVDTAAEVRKMIRTVEGA